MFTEKAQATKEVGLKHDKSLLNFSHPRTTKAVISRIDALENEDLKTWSFQHEAHRQESNPYHLLQSSIKTLSLIARTAGPTFPLQSGKNIPIRSLTVTGVQDGVPG